VRTSSGTSVAIAVERRLAAALHSSHTMGLGMPDRSRPSFVRYVVYETLIVVGATAGILAFLWPLVGLEWAVVLIVIVVLIAIIVALAIHPMVTHPPAQPAPTSEPPTKPPTKETTPVPPAPPPAKIELALSRPFAHPAPEAPKSEHLESRLGSAYLRARAAGEGAAKRTAQTLPPTPPRFAEEQIMAGKMIEVHDVTSVRLQLKKGDRLYGHLREIDGFEFTWTIVDLKNLGLAERGEEYYYEVGEEDVPSATVEWTVPSDGPWFLMFNAYRKQYTRQIVIDLWRRFPQ
jgi:hypothetical protein